MHKAEPSVRVPAHTSMSRPSTDAALSAMLSIIADVPASGETVRIAGSGTLSTKSPPAHRGRTPAPARASSSRRRTRLPS